MNKYLNPQLSIYVWILHSVYDHVIQRYVYNVGFMWFTRFSCHFHAVGLRDLHPSGLTEFSSGNKCTSTACHDGCWPSRSASSSKAVTISLHACWSKLICTYLIILIHLPIQCRVANIYDVCWCCQCKNLVLHVPIARPQCQKNLSCHRQAPGTLANSACSLAVKSMSRTSTGPSCKQIGALNVTELHEWGWAVPVNMLYQAAAHCIYI